MFSACFGPSVVSDTDFQIHIIIHCSTDWLFQRSIVPPREKCIIEDSWVMQAKEVHMFSQNCTIIRQKKLFYCLFMAFCSDCAFFRSVLSPVLIFVLSWRNKTRKKSEKKIIGAWCVTNRPDRCPSFVSGVCMHSVIENCNLFWILAVIYHKHSLCELCVCAFFLFFSLFRLSDSQKIVVRHRLWGNKREHRSLFNDIFFFISYAHFIVSDHHRGVFNNNTEKIVLRCFVLANKHSHEKGLTIWWALLLYFHSSHVGFAGRNKRNIYYISSYTVHTQDNTIYK